MSSQYVPLYEAKMLHHFNHRWGTYEGATQAQLNVGTLPPLSAEQLSDPTITSQPKYWVGSAELDSRLEKYDRDGNLIWKWEKSWLVGFRNITSAVVFRTVIATILPRVAIGHSTPIIFPANQNPVVAALLVGNLSAFVLDYVARQKVGGINLTYGYVNQLAVLPPQMYRGCVSQIVPAVLELVYTAYDLNGFARDCGYEGEPFHWDEDRRFQLRCELDAVYFHLYGIERDEVDYIMETFPIVKERDETAHREYRTKRAILEIYDAMQEAIETGVSYQTRLDPPPANGWTPTEDLLTAAFASATTYAQKTSEPAVVREESAEYELVSPPSTPKPMKDKDGEILRVRVYTADGEIALNRGVALERRKNGEVTTWTVLAEGETVSRQFQSPPAVLKKLKARST